MSGRVCVVFWLEHVKYLVFLISLSFFNTLTALPFSPHFYPPPPPSLCRYPLHWNMFPHLSSLFWIFSPFWTVEELAARVISCSFHLSLIGAMPLVRDFCVPAWKPGSFALFLLNLSTGWAFWPLPPCSFMFSSFFQSGNVWVVTVTGYCLPDAFVIFFLIGSVSFLCSPRSTFPISLYTVLSFLLLCWCAQQYEFEVFSTFYWNAV